MPVRTIQADGATWEVHPTGRITQSDHDEFGLTFVRRSAEGPPEVRFTRYVPQRALSRAASLAELGSDDLARLLACSQPSATAPEADYTR